MDNSAPDISAAVTDTASHGLVVQSYCNQITQQPDIHLPDDIAKEMPPVNTYLKTARTNATFYLNDLQPKILSSIVDVSGYSSQFMVFFDVIQKKLELWEGGDASAKASALELLKLLHHDLGEKKNALIIVRNDIGAFQTGKLNRDVANFADCRTQADIIITGDKGMIETYNKQIKDINNKIAGAAAGVGVSALGIVGGVLMILGGSVASFITAGTSTTVALCGVGLYLASIGGLTGSSIALHKLLQEKRNILYEKKALEDNYKIITDLDSTFAVFKTSAENASKSLQSMHDAWTILEAELQNVIGDLANAQTSSSLPLYTQVYLKTAHANWETVRKTVETVKQQMFGVKSLALVDAQGRPLSLTDMSEKEIYDIMRRKAS